MKGYRIIRTFFIMIADIVFLIGSWSFAIILSSYFYRNYNPLIETVLDYGHIWTIYYLAAYMIMGVYHSMWQYVGVGMILRLITATVTCNFAIYCTLRLLTDAWPNPAIGMLSVFFMMTLSIGIRVFTLVRRSVVRLWWRLRGKVSTDMTEPIRVLMVGAGESAATLLLQLNKHTEGSRSRRVFSIVDKNPRKHGYQLHGIRVEGDDTQIPGLVDKYDIEEVLIAIPSITNSEMQQIIRQVPVNRCKVRIIRPFEKQSDSPRGSLRDLEIGDILGRPEINLNSDEISSWICGCTVLITGGGGSIGSELTRQLLEYAPEKIIIYDISENNAYNLQQEIITVQGRLAGERVIIRIGSVTDEKRVAEVMAEFKPSIIFHAAAFKHVPLMEECPDLAVNNNVTGTRTMGLAAIKHGVKRFVLVSTDKAVNPTNIMGASKRMAELVVQSLNSRGITEFVAVRFGNVLGSNGSIIPLFRQQIEVGGPVTVTHPDVIRFFMTIPEAAQLVIQSGAMAKGGEIFILDMGNPIKISDLAENLIRIAGFIPGVDIKIEYTGLRPGEKLYEELLLNEEGITKTQSDKIYVASPTKVPASLEQNIADDIALYSDDVMTLIQKYVPEYRKGSTDYGETGEGGTTGGRNVTESGSTGGGDSHDVHFAAVSG